MSWKDYRSELDSNSPSTKSPQIIEKYKPHYTQAAKKQNIKGEIVLTAVFGKDGTISDITIKSGLGYGLDEAAIDATKRIRFIPAQENGQAINFKGLFSYNF